MDRTTGTNNIDIGGGRRGFRDRSALAGLAGTELTALWHNAVQEEIVKVIETAGLTLDPDDWTQLLQALGKLYAPATARYWSLRNASGTIPASVETRMGSWGASAVNMPASAISTSAGTVTIGAGDAGVYVVSAAGAVNSATVTDLVAIRVNGTDMLYQSMQSPSDVTLQDPSCGGILVLAAGDVVDTTYYQARSGGGSNTLVSTGGSFAGVRIGVLP